MPAPDFGTSAKHKPNIKYQYYLSLNHDASELLTTAPLALEEEPEESGENVRIYLEP